MPGDTIISSNDLTVAIKSKGAEICSVKNKQGLEFIWQASPDVWARHAPILFPIVGKLKDNSYKYKARSYQLPQHGFARDMDFRLTASEKNSCTFQLNSTNETHEKYPFEFILQVRHEVKGSSLVTSYAVKNPAAGELYFSVGAHPGFRCPLLPGEKFEDYFLEFEKTKYSQTLLQDGLLSENKTNLELPDKKIFLSASLFDKDALVFENHQISSIMLRSQKSDHFIKMSCQNWPFFGIWSKKGNTEFICLEPWFGIADTINSDQQLESKHGIISLAAGEEFSCAFSLEFR